MTLPEPFRPAAALALIVGLFLALPGCGGGDAPKPDDKKGDKKGEPKPNPDPNAKPAPTPDSAPKTPVNIDTKSGVGKDAIDFLSAVGAGTAKASQLSAGFVRLIGLPVELDGDKAKGYSADAAEAWLKRVGAKLTGMGPMSESTQVGDVAVFRGAFIGGGYWLRMVREGDAWKVDWLSLSSANTMSMTPHAGGGPSGDAVLQVFAASAFAGATCDKDGMPRDDRVAVIAAGLTPALRRSWAEPFGGDKDKGYDYSPAKLGLKLGEIGGEAVTVTLTGDAMFKMEVTKPGGAKAASTLKLAKSTAPGQWLVESVNPQ